MSKNTKRKEYKTYLAIERKIDEIEKAEEALGWVELDEPYHYGYYEKLILREDVARRIDSDVLIYLIERYSEKSFSFNSKFDSAYRSKPRVRNISKDEYDELEPQYRRYFTTYDFPWTPKEERSKSYHFKLESHFMTTAVEKRYLTHEKVSDPAHKKELDFLHSQLWEIYRELNPFNERKRIRKEAKRQNKMNRRNDKMALKKNLNTEYLAEFTFWTDWCDWGGTSAWSDDFYNFTYAHRRRARWDWW